MFLERKICPVCSNHEYDTLHNTCFTNRHIKEFLIDFYTDLPSELFVGAHDYKIAECRKCRAIYQLDILDAEHMTKLYSEWISASESQHKTVPSRTLNKQRSELRTLLKRVGCKPEKSSVFEFGMGWGEWSLMAKQLGCKVSAHELSIERVEEAKKKGVDAHSNLEFFTNKKFDLIYSNQVFEHIPNPLETARAFSQMLHPGGIMCLKVPEGNNMKQKITETSTPWELKPIHPLEHINCYTQHSWNILAKTVDLQVIKSPFYVDTTNFTTIAKDTVDFFRRKNRSSLIYLQKSNKI